MFAEITRGQSLLVKKFTRSALECCSLTQFLVKIVTFLCLASAGVHATEEITFFVQPEPFLKNVPRIGVNLGGWATWGASQLMSNIVPNPGFEGCVDRHLVVVSEASSHSFSADVSWIAKPDDFWKGARYDIRTGQFAGTEGAISHSLKEGRNGLPEYFSEDLLPYLEKNDIVVVTKMSSEASWWIPEDSQGRILPQPGDARPGSPGVQSLGFFPRFRHPAKIVYHFDDISSHAGKMLPINGKWRLSFWARSEGENDVLQVLLERVGKQTHLFFKEKIPLSQEWKEYTFDYDLTDDGPGGFVKLWLIAHGKDHRVLVDDLQLGQRESLSFPFRQEVVEALLKIRPGCLRNLRNFAEAGNTLANLLAEPFARRQYSVFPGGGKVYDYSLPEFLDLCRRVGANPWIIVPVTFSDEEYAALGEFLTNYREDFGEILIEFGNENWNWVFGLTGIPEVEQHGEMAERAFAFIEKGARSQVPLVKVVNGQYAWPENAFRFARSSPSADLLGIAPYYLSSLSKGLPEETRLKKLLHRTHDLLPKLAEGVKSLKKGLVVYEINAHTTKGDASPEERNPVIAGMAAGTALAKRMLEALSSGVRYQAVSSFTGYESGVSGMDADVKLWGIVRDVGETQRMRPTGLATMMLNRAIGGDYYSVLPSEKMDDQLFTLAAFKKGLRWSAAITSSDSKANEIQIVFPENEKSLLPNKILQLHAEHPLDMNEEEEKVTIREFPVHALENKIRLTIPAYGLCVLIYE